jgi:hypothetical protein
MLGSDGGVWLNCGPLKWHQNAKRPIASRYTWEELLLLVSALGFEIVETDLVETEYQPLPPGGEMQREVYTCGFFVARLRKEK